MTTTLMPPETPASAERSLRILSIAANLLPVEIVDSRTGRKIRRAVLAALAAFLVVVAGWYALATTQTVVAAANLYNAEDDVKHLQQQQRAFSDVVTVQAQSQAISAQLSIVLANDLQWSQLLTALQSAAPSGIKLTGVTGALNSTANAAGSKIVQLPNTSGLKPVGTLSVRGTASGKADIAAYVDALAKVNGLANPYLGDATVQDNKLGFTVKLDITEAALGGRFTKTGKGSGDN
jgi:Tfp pilus assembly protein PilN